LNSNQYDNFSHAIIQDFIDSLHNLYRALISLKKIKYLYSTFMNFLYFTLFLFSLTFSLAHAQTQTRSEDLTHYKITEMILKNGLRVCLKSSDLEKEEFSFLLSAVGGYAGLPAADQKSAWLATEIALESGLDQQSGEELKSTLDDRSILMGGMFGPFDRQIEATGPTSELAYCLRLTQLLFTNPQFNENGLKNALAQARNQLQQKAKAEQFIESDFFIKSNMKNWYMMTPFNIFDLDKIELPKAELLFKQFFSNPAEFVFILVGDFNPQEIIPLLENTLGSLPNYPVKKWIFPIPPPFPEGITKREKQLSGNSRFQETHTRMTFPLSPSSIDPLVLEFLDTILKQRFLAEVTPENQWKKEIKIGHQFPLFPHLDPLWLVISYTSPSCEVEDIRQSILQTLENIKETIAEKEIKTAYQKLVADRPAISNNAYELSLLANYYQASWDILTLYTLPYSEKDNNTMVEKVLECYPDLNQYSIISIRPKPYDTFTCCHWHYFK
jgi:zinc protease